MSIATSLEDNVYIGLWMNRSYGPLKGATLTLTRQTGGLLIAFLALFVAATGRSFWKIVRYAIHVAVATDLSSDGVYHQRQAILRNNHLPIDAAWDLFRVRWAWRSKGRRLDARLSTITFLALLVAATFAISGKH